MEAFLKDESIRSMVIDAFDDRCQISKDAFKYIRKVIVKFVETVVVEMKVTAGNADRFVNQNIANRELPDGRTVGWYSSQADAFVEGKDDQELFFMESKFKGVIQQAIANNTSDNCDLDLQDIVVHETFARRLQTALENFLKWIMVKLCHAIATFNGRRRCTKDALGCFIDPELWNI